MGPKESDVMGPTKEEIEAAVRLGVAALAEDRLGEAVELLSLATRCAPHHVDGLVSLGIAHARQGKLVPAIAVLERAVSLDPDHFFAHLRLSELYRCSRRRPRSREHLRAALDVARTPEERAVVQRALADAA
jgi:Flp pilus assembly protein TadD